LNLHDSQRLLSRARSPDDNDENPSAVKISSRKHQYHDIPLLDAAEVGDVAQSKSKTNTDDSERGLQGAKDLPGKSGKASPVYEESRKRSVRANVQR
jgi:hypothetical protein